MTGRSKSSRLRQSLREIEEKVPRLLSLGGREGPGQQINGDYELLEGVRPNGRPCWLRRGRPLLTVNSNGLAEHDGDLKPLYLFFGEMGYWNIAASVLAAGVHVLARSGPDFSSASPDLCQMPWTIFAFGKAHKDSSIVCFRHERNKVEVVHVTGCRGDHGQLNGNYQLLRGVRMGSRPIFVKDGFGARGEEERKVLHFTQRAGRWFISSVTLSALEEERLSTSSDCQDADLPQWRCATTLARSPVAWTSSSPASLPHEPWSIIRQLPTHLQYGMTERRRRAESMRLADENDMVSEDAPVTFIPCQELQVNEGFGRKASSSIGRSLSYASQRSGSLSPKSPDKSDGSPKEALDITETAEICGTEQETEYILCLHFLNHEGIAESFGISGDYVRSDQLYGDRPVFIKAPLRQRGGILDDDRVGQERHLFLFYNDLTFRWKVAPEVGAKGLSVLARSPVGWDEVLCSEEEGAPRDLGPWQLRTMEPELSIGRRKNEMQIPEDSNFQNCPALEVVAVEDRSPSRTVSFFYQGPEAEAQALAEHPLAGDFRLLRQRYGKRPVYRRAPLQTCGPRPSLPSQPGLFLFFEPRSGYWVVSTISPLAANHAIAFARPDVLGRFGQVLARSGPAWSSLLPQEAPAWDAADSQVPGFHHRLSTSRAPPSALLSDQLMPTEWLQLMASGTDASPTFLCVGGCGSRVQSLNGSYELLPESMWASRPAWKKMRPEEDDEEDHFPKYIFFWPETGHWIIGPELHVAQTGLARNGPGRWAAHSPDHCPGRWAALDGSTFSEDPKIFVRRQKAAFGGLDTFGLSSAMSPCQSLGPRAKALPCSPRACRSAIFQSEATSRATSPTAARNSPLPKSGGEDRRLSSPRISPREMQLHKMGGSPKSPKESHGSPNCTRFAPREVSPQRNTSPVRTRGICWRP